MRNKVTIVLNITLFGLCENAWFTLKPMVGLNTYHLAMGYRGNHAFATLQKHGYYRRQPCFIFRVGPKKQFGTQEKMCYGVHGKINWHLG